MVSVSPLENRKPHALPNPNFIVILLISMGLLTYGWYQRATVQAQAEYVPTGVVTSSTDEPSEKHIPLSAKYEVAANMPRRIIIPAIGVNNFVQPVGIDQRKAIAVPQNINLAGWFNLGASPGEIGVSIIDGHVSGKKFPGAFKKLNKLQVGDEYKVEMGDRSIRKFRVTKSESFTLEQANTELYRQFDARQLTLITCTGRYDKQLQDYQKRHIVYAKRLP